MEFKILSLNDVDEVISLGCELNPTIPESTIRNRLIEMFSYPNYYCFGAFSHANLIAITSGWITTRFYSGKQLEIDNVIVNKDMQSKGIGKELLSYIENWAIENGCLTIELNTYVTNNRSHKFYFNQGFKLLGFHFQKLLTETV